MFFTTVSSNVLLFWIVDEATLKTELLYQVETMLVNIELEYLDKQITLALNEATTNLARNRYIYYRYLFL